MANRESLHRQNQQMTLKPVPTFLEFNSTRRSKKHSTIPLKYIDVTKSTHTDLDVLQEKKIDDCWHVDSGKHLSDSWRGFTKFTLLKGSLQKDTCGPVGD